MNTIKFKILLCTVCFIFTNSLFAQDTSSFLYQRTYNRLSAKGIPDAEIQNIIKTEDSIYQDFLNKEIAEQEIMFKNSLSNVSQSTVNCSDIPQTEREVLQAIYANLSGGTWANYWDFNQQVTNWSNSSGVTVQNCHVVALNLTGADLHGTIPNLTNLPFLKSLRIFVNNFNPYTNLYPISSNSDFNSIGTLQNLEYLIINNADFGGIMPNSFTNLNLLEYFELYHCNLNNVSQLDSIISGFTNLKVLTLSFNFIGTGSYDFPLPQSFSSLTNLERIYFNNSRVNNIDVLNSLNSLIHINFGKNTISGNFPNLSNLTNLNYLDLSFNTIEDIIPAFLQQNNFAILELEYNKLYGAIPSLTINGSGWTTNRFWIHNNFFRFNDFINDFNYYNTVHFAFGNQGKTDNVYTINTTEGQPVHMEMCVDGNFHGGDTYQWFKNGVQIGGETSRVYNFTADVNSGGNYYCESYHLSNPDMTNNVGTNDFNKKLTLRRNTITLIVAPTPACPTVTGNITSPNTSDFCLGESYNFNFEFDNPPNPSLTYTYNWTYINNGVSSSTQTSPSIVFNQSGYKYISLNIIDSNGCEYSFNKQFVVQDCTACTYNNSQHNTIKDLFIALVNKLQSLPAGTVTQGYTCQELTDLAPYITDPNPAIYNFYNNGYNLSFSFNNHGTQYNDNDVYISLSSNYYPIQDLYLFNYSSPDISTWPTAIGLNGHESGDDPDKIMHIDFCPNPVEEDCKIHFSFNYATPNGVLNNNIRLEIGTGQVNFINANVNSQLYVTSIDDHSTGVRYRPAQQEIITPWDQPIVNTSNEVKAGVNLSIQNDNYLSTVSNEFNGIVTNSAINEFINVTFVIASQDTFTSITNEKAAHDALLNSGKTDKIFYILFENGLFRDNSTNPITNYTPLDYVNLIKGGNAIDYNATSNVLDSDYKIFSVSEYTNANFDQTIQAFIQKAYEDVKEDICSPDESCTTTNPNTTVVQGLLLDLLEYLIQQKLNGVADNLISGTMPQQLIALSPYITDVNPKIYNFISSSSPSNPVKKMSFSFSQNSADNIILDGSNFVGINSSNFQFDLSNYNDPNIGINIIDYTFGNHTIKSGFINHIDFCPDELYCTKHIAIVVDESGSIDEKEARKIRFQLKSFIEKQANDNVTLGTNVRVSLIGLSDSDTDSRTNPTTAIPNNGNNILISDILTNSNKQQYLNWILGYRKQNRVSPNSDYWNSGLTKALEIGADFVILITDGCQTNSETVLKTTMQGFNNYINPPSDSEKPHLFVVGIEDGFYVDNPSANKTSILPKEEDPNLNPEISKSSGSTAKVASFLRISLKYLMNYNSTSFPIMDKYGFLADYFGTTDFNFLYDEPNYLSNGLIAKATSTTNGETTLIKPVNMSCGVIIPLEGCSDCLNFKLDRNKEYIVSTWVKEERNDQVITFENPFVQVTFLDISETILDVIDCNTSGDIIDGWQRIFKKLEVPNEASYIQIALVNNSPNIPVYFDDIRIHPLDGSMKSFVYDPETFRLMAELDENNYTTFYEYDKEGGLVRVKKETSRGIKTIQETRSGNVIKQD